MKKKTNLFSTHLLPLAVTSAALMQFTMPGASAATLTWDSGNTSNGSTIDAGSGTWDTTVGNVVWNNAGTNVAWTAANDAVFGGADGTYAITVGGSFSAQRMIFNNSGYTLSASSAQTITLTNLNNTSPSIAIASGKSATIGSNVTVTTGGTIYIGSPTGTSNTAGTLNIDGGTVTRTTGNSSILLDGNGLIVNVKTGGTISKTTGTGQIGVGWSAGSSATLNVQGGTVSVGSTTGTFSVGASGQGTVNLTNGSITLANTTSGTGGVTFGSVLGNVSSNVFNLDGGTLTTLDVHKGAGTGSTATFNFNSGTLKAAANTTSFMTGLDFAYVKSGGAIIDTQAFNVTIAQNLLTDTVSTGGGLTKSAGSGTLTLTGNNTFTGATTISAGNLNINGTALQNSYLDTTNSITGSSSAGLQLGTGSALNIGGLSGNKDLSTIFNTSTGTYSTVASITLNVNSANTLSYSGAIANGSGATTLTKSGTGTQTLSGTNTYTGTTTVSAGVLAVNGTLANTTTTVGNTATLRGIGSIGGSVTVQNGGTIASGNSIESLATGALTLNGGSTFAYEMNKDAAASVAGDLTAVTGNLTLDLSTAAVLSLAELGSGTWTAGEKLTLISYSGTWNGGLFNYNGNTLLDDSTITFSGIDWKFNYDDTTSGTNYTGDLVGSSFVTMTAVPEPASALLGGLGLIMLLRRRRC